MTRQKSAEKIGDILRNFIEASGLGNNLKHLEIYGAWEEIVGPAILRHARVAGFKAHKLYVEVDSSTHLQELRTFYKKQLLDDLRAKVSGVLIEDIVFRPAPLNRS